MSTTKGRSNDMKFEIVVIPVSDVDRAKEFYARLGWRLDAEFASGDDFRVIQFTPPGSGCSVIFGKNVTAAAPGSAQGLYLIVSDIVAARDELRGRGVEVSEVFHSDGVYAGTDEPYLFGRRRTSNPAAYHSDSRTACRPVLPGYRIRFAAESKNVSIQATLLATMAPCDPRTTRVPRLRPVQCCRQGPEASRRFAPADNR